MVQHRGRSRAIVSIMCDVLQEERRLRTANSVRETPKESLRKYNPWSVSMSSRAKKTPRKYNPWSVSMSSRAKKTPRKYNPWSVSMSSRAKKTPRKYNPWSVSMSSRAKKTPSLCWITFLHLFYLTGCRHHEPRQSPFSCVSRLGSIASSMSLSGLTGLAPGRLPTSFPSLATTLISEWTFHQSLSFFPTNRLS